MKDFIFSGDFKKKCLPAYDNVFQPVGDGVLDIETNCIKFSLHNVSYLAYTINNDLRITWLGTDIISSSDEEIGV